MTNKPSPREWQVFLRLGDGIPRSEICKIMNIKGKTYDTLISRLGNKLGLSNASELKMAAVKAALNLKCLGKFLNGPYGDTMRKISEALRARAKLYRAQIAEDEALADILEKFVTDVLAERNPNPPTSH